MDKIARRPEWLATTLACTVKSDAFTCRLLDMSAAVHKEGLAQQLYLGVHRSDYMMDGVSEDAAAGMLQVELNTIASSFGCLGSRTSRLHRFLLARTAAGREFRNGATGAAGAGGELPANDVGSNIAGAIAKAHEAYGKKDALVVFVVQPGELNVIDQKHIEFALWEAHGLPVRRMTLAELERDTVLSGGDERRLVLRGAKQPQQEIAVLYFRAGYTPDDYPTETEWAGRLKVERSRAVKCPSVAYQLVGTKKVQQVLAGPGGLDAFVPDKAQQRTLQSCFAAQHAMGPGADPAVMAEAAAHPERFVMKPQREGGGNNLYGADIPAALDAMSDDELGAHVLMQRIVPVPAPVTFLKTGNDVVAGKGVFEMGVFSMFVGDGKGKPLVNRHGGHVLRSKMDGVDEGGVAAGFAVINSPLLVE